MTDNIGSIYVMGNHVTHSVKIGWAFDPVRRVTDLQTGSPARLRILATLPGNRRTESALHRAFSDRREHGEWFDFGTADPVAAVAKAWLGLQPAVTQDDEPFVDDPPDDDWDAAYPLATPSQCMLSHARDCFRDGEESLPMPEIVARLLAVEGRHWWHHEWTVGRESDAVFGMRLMLDIYDIPSASDPPTIRRDHLIEVGDSLRCNCTAAVSA